MLSQATVTPTSKIQTWPIDQLIFYARNPRKNDSAVDRIMQQYPGIRFQNPGTRPQRRRGRRWPPAPEGGAQVGIVARRRHHWNPSNPLRRVDRCPGPSISPDGQSFRDMGRVGLRIGFLHHQQIIRNKGRTFLTRTLYWFQHEPCWFVRKKNAPWYGKAGENSTIWDSPSPKFIMGGSDERNVTIRRRSRSISCGGRS